MFANQLLCSGSTLESESSASEQLTRAAHGGVEASRRAAIAADRATSDVASLAEVWHALESGQSRVMDAFVSDDRCYLLLAQTKAGAPRRNVRAAYKFEVLARTLLVGAQKSVAFEFNIAPSTVALLTKDALASMGFRCLPSQTPSILVMAAHAVQSGRNETCRASHISDDAGQLRVVSVPRPDLAIASLLPPAECIVTRLLVEGRRRAEIAQLRCTSERTVANQLGAAFRRLRASGRLDLIRRLVVDATDGTGGGDPPQASRPSALAS